MSLPEKTTLHGAVVTPSTRGGEKIFSGEVYRDGSLVHLALRPSDRATYKHVPLPLNSAPEKTLRGNWLYAGFVFEIFGHDLLEIPGRLWPALAGEPFDGVVCHRWRADSSSVQAKYSATSRRILEWFGMSPDQVHVVEDSAILVERLTVGEAAFRINDRTLPIFKSAIQHISDQVTVNCGSMALYLSRRRLPGPPRFARETDLEQFAGHEGYKVIHPQALRLDDQIALMKRAKAVAGVDGSAMHLTAFCRPGTKVTCFDTRRHPNQFIIDEMFELDATHIDVANFSVAEARASLRL